MRYKKISYSGRHEKAEFVAEEFSEKIQNKTLDVGADSQNLKPYVEKLGGVYTGVGFGNCDLEIDLDSNALPFANGCFNCVLCLDTLEHLEHAHFIFDELCRVSEKWVIISLPNPYGTLFSGLTKKQPDLKFYGLPRERPSDRHRWFFNINDATHFVSHNAKKNNFNVIGFMKKQRGRTRADRLLLSATRRLCNLGGRGFSGLELDCDSVWFVLQKDEK